MSFLTSPVSSAISSAASVSNTAATNATNLKIARETNENQIQLWREQQQHDIEMWERENQYNSPAEQMARLQAAGINPLLLDGSNPVGNATQSAGGQTPPQLSLPQMQPANLDFTSFSQMAKNFADANKANSEADVFGQSYEFAKEMAIKGINPELIRAQVSLQEYVKLKKENKYLPQFIESQIAKMNSERDFQSMAAKEREEMCRRIKAETKGIKLTNKFNAQQFPEQLRMLAEQIKSEIQRRSNETNLATAQINAANATKELTESQTNLVDENVIKEQFENGLRKYGINPNAKTLPFFANIAVKLSDGSLSAPQVADFFQNLAYADRVGWDKIAKSNANLTKFELQGSQTGMFGSGLNIRDFLQQLTGMMLSSPVNKPVGLE